jgi:hypothetical protein
LPLLLPSLLPLLLPLQVFADILTLSEQSEPQEKDPEEASPSTTVLAFQHR